MIISQHFFESLLPTKQKHQQCLHILLWCRLVPSQHSGKGKHAICSSARVPLIPYWSPAHAWEGFQEIEGENAALLQIQLYFFSENNIKHNTMVDLVFWVWHRRTSTYCSTTYWHVHLRWRKSPWLCGYVTAWLRGTRRHCPPPGLNRTVLWSHLLFLLLQWT